MRILTAREPGYLFNGDDGYNDPFYRLTRNPDPYRHYGQWITYEDGSTEFDKDFAQTADIIQAEQYNGKAAKDDDGQWVHAPGPRNHNDEHEILGFHVGLSYERHDSDGKAVWDYSVITPTGVAFHGDGKNNVFHTPSGWSDERVACEAIFWICLGEDSGTDFPEDTTAEQWTWIRSPEREMASAEIDEYVESLDRQEQGKVKEQFMRNLANDVQASRDAIIEVRAKDYQERCIYANQTGLVTHLLSEDSDYLSYDDIVNYYPNVDAMDGNQLAEYISDELGEDWRKLDLIDITDYIFCDEDSDPVDPDTAMRELNPLDLEEYDLEQLREYIRNNQDARDIFEWYLVDGFLADDLEALGHPTLTDGSNHWWGRRTTGQFIIHDGVLQQIAAKYI